MGSSKEVGGVGLAFGGFVLLTLAFKGTWGNVWDALLGRHGTAQASATGAGLASYLPPGGVTDSGPAGTAPPGLSRPGGAPVPQPAPGGQHPFVPPRTSGSLQV